MIVERIKHGDERPSLTGAKSFVDEVADLLKEREPLYRAAADWSIETDERGPKEVSQEIIKRLLVENKDEMLIERLSKGIENIEAMKQEG